MDVQHFNTAQNCAYGIPHLVPEIPQWVFTSIAPGARHSTTFDPALHPLRAHGAAAAVRLAVPHAEPHAGIPRMIKPNTHDRWNAAR